VVVAVDVVADPLADLVRLSYWFGRTSRSFSFPNQLLPRPLDPEEARLPARRTGPRSAEPYD
jgi:hypothetical protein